MNRISFLIFLSIVAGIVLSVMLTGCGGTRSATPWFYLECYVSGGTVVVDAEAVDHGITTLTCEELGVQEVFSDDSTFEFPAKPGTYTFVVSYKHTPAQPRGTPLRMFPDSPDNVCVLEVAELPTDNPPEVDPPVVTPPTEDPPASDPPDCTNEDGDEGDDEEGNEDDDDEDDYGDDEDDDEDEDGDHEGSAELFGGIMDRITFGIRRVYVHKGNKHRCLKTEDAQDVVEHGNGHRGICKKYRKEH